MDATLTTSALVFGHVNDPTSIEIDQKWNIKCDGPDCDSATEFYANGEIRIPCISQWIIHFTYIGSE